MVKTRAELDEAMVRLLADALVRELRAEMAAMDDAVQGERPAADQSDPGAKCASEARTCETTPLPIRRAS
jgi:hypothetical protein